MTRVSSDPFCNCPGHFSSAHIAPATKRSLLWRVLLLVSAFAGLEFLVGQVSHSLALKADSGHMLSDGLALAIALFATWMAQESSSHTGSKQRQVEVWAALINGVGLLGMAGLIGWEAYCHLQAPPTEILSVPMLVTAVIGLVINGINVGLLHGTDAQDLNLRGALLHVLADVISSIGVILAAIAVWIWGWTWADGVISVAVAVLIGTSALPLIRQSFSRLRSPFTQSSQLKLSSQINVDVNGVKDRALMSDRGFCEIGQTDLEALITGKS
ncbi:MAG: cation transporter [Merismopedia sp. SIO2A8]|nr:cation transporter [Merismopedia sp. SIO2A8]